MVDLVSPGGRCELVRGCEEAVPILFHNPTARAKDKAHLWEGSRHSLCRNKSFVPQLEQTACTATHTCNPNT